MIKIFETPEETVLGFAENLELLINNSILQKEQFNLALSGGNTPQLLFNELKNNFRDSVDWSFVHFFWGDERCVNSNSPESNYGTADKLFLNSINIPKENIHSINGEENPEVEAKRYSEEIVSYLPQINNLPCFDLVILGLGNDGHTASIFPNQMQLLDSNKICEVAYHPQTMQKRITLTGKVLNNAKNISFLVLGDEKSKVVGEIFNKNKNYKEYPSFYIKPTSNNITWFMDEAAGKLVESKMLKNP